MRTPVTYARAYVARRVAGSVSCAVEELAMDELGEGDVTVEITWSGANYKDALATRADGKVARLDRLVPGVDLAGTVVESASDDFDAGDSVLAHGYGLGVSHNGGFATHARLPAEWLVPLPEGLTAREAMVVGTAGFTAALCLGRLEKAGVVPGDKPVLVTGATGGVGSFAVAMLARRGFEVVASTGKVEAGSWLRELGAAAIVDRAELAAPARPLEAQRFGGAIDSVGGSTLAHVLSAVAWGGAVAACGSTGGSALSTTVFPFILRGVSLLGVDSTATPMGVRRETWGRIASELGPTELERIVAGEVGLGALAPVLDELLAGAVRGRVLVRPG